MLPVVRRRVSRRVGLWGIIFERVTLSNSIMQKVWGLPNLTPTQLLILVRIADRASDSGLAWPGQTSLARDCGVTKRTVSRSIQELIEAGYLAIATPPDWGKSTVYKVITTGGGDVRMSPGVRMSPVDIVSPGEMSECHLGDVTMSPGEMSECHPNPQLTQIESKVNNPKDIQAGDQVDLFATETEPKKHRRDYKADARQVITWINEISGRSFSVTNKTYLTAFAARIKEVKDEPLSEVRKMLDRQWQRVRGTEWEEHYCPSTLSRLNKFPQYWDKRDLPVIPKTPQGRVSGRDPSEVRNIPPVVGQSLHDKYFGENKS